jgi:SAM-dependent methyltransferase
VLSANFGAILKGLAPLNDLTQYKDSGYWRTERSRIRTRPFRSRVGAPECTGQVVRSVDRAVVPGCRDRTWYAVLDVGSGSGDLAFLAARIVGPSGEVIGADKSPAAVATASRRAAALQLSNVRFLEGDPAEMPFEQPFDAVVGRLVLMYHPSPAESIRKLAIG